MSTFPTLKALLAWLLASPDGTQIDARTLARVLQELKPEEAPASSLQVDPPGPEWTWRERLWVVPAERRLSTREVLEALGRSRTWLYGVMAEERRAERFPHKKLDGELVFVAGEVRAWIRDQEEEVAGWRVDSTNEERRGLHVA